MKADKTGILFSDLPLQKETVKALRAFCGTWDISVKPEENHVACLVKIADAFGTGHLEKEQANFLIQPFFRFLREDFNRFLRTVYYKNKKGKYQKLVLLFKTNRRDARDKKAADWELLRLCDDYVNGKFRTNGGKTRVYLYYFAMMFGMIFRLPETGSVREDARFDLVKNLFEDYYSDNVIRFLSEEYADGKAVSQYESEPAGDGINYKNYAEIIYLYYLYHREIAANPGESIDRAERLISDCRKSAMAAEKKDPGIYSRKMTEGFTDYFRDEYFRRFLEMEEDDLQAFILGNYRILSKENEGRSMIMVSAEENTAYDNVELIMENLNDIYGGTITASRLLALGKFEDAEEKSAVRRELRESEDVFLLGTSGAAS
ncbi:MAG: hypothetical protein LUG54_02065 [Clostridiales bacterium]|nr:hypothetical protein [Clostridiales bacterium]